MNARARRRSVREQLYAGEYRVEWMRGRNVHFVETATLARATDLLLEAFGGDAPTRRRGSGYEVLNADGCVVARMWRA